MVHSYQIICHLKGVNINSENSVVKLEPIFAASGTLVLIILKIKQWTMESNIQLLIYNVPCYGSLPSDDATIIPVYYRTRLVHMHSLFLLVAGF